MRKHNHLFISQVVVANILERHSLYSPWEINDGMVYSHLQLALPPTFDMVNLFEEF